MITTNINTLRLKSEPTTIEECKSLNLFEQLEKELSSVNVSGVGLSAIQISIAKAACIIRVKNEKYGDLKLNMINPVIEKAYDLQRFQNEGCLSFPGKSADTERYHEVLVKWFDYDSEEERRATFMDLEAVVIQHEIDHMHGIVFLDRKAKAKEKVGRNDPCPCGSGKKYKKCCEGK